MTRLVLLNITFLLTFCACKSEIANKNTGEIAKGGKSYGGVFKLSIPSKPSRLFPYSSNSYYEQQLSSQLFETLFTTDSAQKSAGNLAERYELLDHGMTFRIYLRKNIRFHGSGVALNSKDVLFSLAFLCSASKENSYSYLLIDKIKGAKTFYDNSKTNNIDLKKFSGAKIIDDFIIDVYLTFPYSQFPQLLSHPNLVILSYENFQNNNDGFFKNPVGTGAFRLEKITEEKIRIVRNDAYWKCDEHGNQLPFLDAVEAYYSVNERDWFQEEKIDMIQNISSEKLNSLFGNLNDAMNGKNQPHRFYQIKNKNLNFLVYNLSLPPFNNQRNREQINAAINARALCENVLAGDGEPTQNAFVPLSFFNSLNNSLEKPIYEKRKAGSDFKKGEKINLFVNKNTSELGMRWVEALILQIEENTSLVVNLVKGSEEDFNKMWKAGEIHIAKYGWVADYPDPDSYLSIFYSKASLAKQIAFNSEFYDRLYLETFRSVNQNERLSKQQTCDRFLIQNTLVTPLFLQDFVFVVNINMRDFRVNTEGQLDFSSVYYKKVPKLN
jgi:peptide/nickel transport system substrate-binding protein